ncbi:MAG: sensor histidine kinase [Coprothermobacterota bacterium]|nr:sensor histidine kinase [Coprothermobacterota bacterium]
MLPETGRAADLAFLLVVAAAYAQAVLVGWDAFTLWQFLGATLAVLAYGALSAHWVQVRLQRSTLVLQLLYFVIQAALAATVITLFGASGFIGLIVLPLASQAVLFLPTPWPVFGFTLALGAVLLPIAWTGGWQAILQVGLAYLAGLVFVALFTQVALDERRANQEAQRLTRELQEANLQLRRYAAQVEELATTKERNRLAREIHDSLGHYLTVVNVQLEAARLTCETDPQRALQSLAQAQAMTREGLAEVRRSVASLRQPATEGRPLAERIARLVEESQAHGLALEFSVSGELPPLSPQAELTLFRAAQEGLTNVRRHAKASHATLILDCSGTQSVRLSLVDNGGGAAQPQDGFGLLGLRERVQLLGGAMHTVTEPGAGFSLEVELPR